MENLENNRKIVFSDLSTSFDLYASIFGLTLRNRTELSKIEEGTDDTFGIILNQGTDKELKGVFKLPEIKLKFCEDAVQKAKRSSEYDFFTTLYSYFGQTLGIYAFLSIFNSDEYDSLKDYKSQNKIALKQLTRAILEAEDRRMLHNNYDPENPKEGDEDYSNELRIAENFTQILEFMDNFNSQSGTMIPTQRILSLTYLSMYYLLLGYLPTMFGTEQVSLTQFIEVCNKKNGALDYIKYILNSNEDISTIKRSLGLLYTFYRLTQFYAINCPVFKLDRDEFSTKNKTFLAICNLGEALENLPEEEEYIRYKDMYLELLHNTVYNNEFTLEMLVDNEDYLSPKPRLILEGDIGSNAIIGYDLTLLINNINRISDDNNNFSLKGYVDSNSLFTNILYLEDKELLNLLPYDEIESYILRELGSESNCVIDPETISRLAYFAAIARYVLLSPDYAKDMEQDRNKAYSMLIHAESLMIRLYNEWFVRGDRVYKSVDRYMLGNKVSTDRINTVTAQLKAEIEFILMNYIECSSVIYNTFNNKDKDDLDSYSLTDVLSTIIRPKLNKKYEHEVLYIDKNRRPVVANDNIYYLNGKDDLFIDSVIEMRDTPVLKLFNSTSISGTSLIDLERLFMELMSDDSNADVKEIRSVLDKCSIDNNRNLIYDVALYAKIVSNFDKIFDSSLSNKEKFLTTWGIILFFVNRKMGDTKYVEEKNATTVIITANTEEKDGDENSIDVIVESTESFIQSMYANNVRKEGGGFYESVLGKSIRK